MIQLLCTGLPELPEDYQPYQYAAHRLHRLEFVEQAHSIKIALVTEGEDLNLYKKFRKALYQMQYNAGSQNFVDLGGYKGGEAGLAELLDFLLKKGIFCVVIGRSNKLPVGLLKAYSHYLQPIRMAWVSSQIHLGSRTNPFVLHRLLEQYPDYLGQLNCIGYQSYFTDPEVLSKLRQYGFETQRLGQLQEQIQDVEPMLRHSHSLGFDLSAIAASQAPASRQPNPNGFTAQAACQIMRYAGMSDQLNSIGIYNYAPLEDHNGQTAMLLAQMFWYAVEGFQQRFGEVPPQMDQLTRYEVQLPVGQLPVSFFKSSRSERWWFYVFEKEESMALDHLDPLRLIPCSYQDYLISCEGDVPERILLALGG